jgi:hypothetical protein
MVVKSSLTVIGYPKPARARASTALAPAGIDPAAALKSSPPWPLPGHAAYPG